MSETNETQLEQTFANLAYTNLRDKAQGLLDYLIGFQMLKVEEEPASVKVQGVSLGLD